jgi:hypothetical protein
MESNPLPKKQDQAPHSESLLGRLQSLAEALARLDSIDPEQDWMAFEESSDKLREAVGKVAALIEPVLARAPLVDAAFRDAACDRRDVPEWCRDCDQAPDGLCDDHEQDLAAAEEYDALRQKITGWP